MESPDPQTPLPPPGTLCYFNGRWISYDQARLPVWDLGFTMGVTLTERLRTYQGDLPLLDRHLSRLAGGLAAIELPLPMTMDDLAQIALRAVEYNRQAIDPESDLGLSLCVTGGAQASAVPTSGIPTDCPPIDQASILVATQPLPFSQWAHQYREGVALATVDIREIPTSSLPRAIKHRNRLHYYLADQQARQRFPGARALLLAADGSVAEATTAAVALVRDGMLLAPPVDSVLPSIAFSIATELAADAGLQLQRRPIWPSEIAEASEVLWFSTSVGVLPVTQFNGEPVGHPEGPVLEDLLQRWSRRLGVNLRAQALKFGSPG